MPNNPQAPKKNESFRDKVADSIEKAGHKISNSGSPGLGQKIHDLGDKLEEKDPLKPATSTQGLAFNQGSL